MSKSLLLNGPFFFFFLSFLIFCHFSNFFIFFIFLIFLIFSLPHFSFLSFFHLSHFFIFFIFIICPIFSFFSFLKNLIVTLEMKMRHFFVDFGQRHPAGGGDQAAPPSRTRKTQHHPMEGKEGRPTQKERGNATPRKGEEKTATPLKQHHPSEERRNAAVPKRGEGRWHDAERDGKSNTTQVNAAPPERGEGKQNHQKEKKKTATPQKERESVGVDLPGLDWGWASFLVLGLAVPFNSRLVFHDPGQEGVGPTDIMSLIFPRRDPEKPTFLIF